MQKTPVQAAGLQAGGCRAVPGMLTAALTLPSWERRAGAKGLEGRTRWRQGSLPQRDLLPGTCRASHGPVCPSPSPATLPTVHGKPATSQMCASHCGSMASTTQHLLLPMPGTLVPSPQTSSGATCPADPTGNSPGCPGWPQKGRGAQPAQGRGAHPAPLHGQQHCCCQTLSLCPPVPLSHPAGVEKPQGNLLRDASSSSHGMCLP